MRSTVFSSRFVAAFLLLVGSALVAFKLGVVLGWHPSAVLSALVVFSFFLGIWELVALTLVSMLLLRFEGGVGLELLLLGALPLTLFLIRTIIVRLEGWGAVLTGIPLALAVFFVLTSPAALLAAYPLFLKDVFASGAFGLILFAILRYGYDEEGYHT